MMDAADWLRNEMRATLEAFDLTMPGLRLIERLNREGAQRLVDVAERGGVKRQTMDGVIARLERRNWVRRAIVTLPPMEFRRSHLPKAREDGERNGRRMRVVGLTRLGKKFLRDVLPTHAKWVRVLDAREQDTLSRICRKLREGDIVKFVSELRTEEEEEELRERAIAGLKEHRRRTGMWRRGFIRG